MQIAAVLYDFRPLFIGDNFPGTTQVECSVVSNDEHSKREMVKCRTSNREAVTRVTETGSPRWPRPKVKRHIKPRLCLDG